VDGLVPIERMPRDFVQIPSQFSEPWALGPAVFANYAGQYQTGKPMPAKSVNKAKKLRAFNQGFAAIDYLDAVLLDLAWHMLPPDAYAELRCV
jgi:peptidyl-dipeptidase Dcp